MPSSITSWPWQALAGFDWHGSHIIFKSLEKGERGGGGGRREGTGERRKGEREEWREGSEGREGGKEEERKEIRREGKK